MSGIVEMDEVADIQNEAEGVAIAEATENELRAEKPRSYDEQSGTEILNLNEIPSNLKFWNFLAALFQAGQCAALFYLSAVSDNDWYLYTDFPFSLSNRKQNPDKFGRPDANEIAGYSLTWYSAVFIALSCIDHLLTVLPGFNSVYNYRLARNQNPFRWTEYTFSASLMRAMIAQISGVTDIHLLFMIFMATATTMILGACHESVNAKARADGGRQNWFPFWAAWIPHLSSWAVILCYFFRSVSRANPPDFVWSIIFILFILDATFALLFYLQWGKISWFRNYIVGEKGFIVLSFTAKTFLAWITYGGASR